MFKSLLINFLLTATVLPVRAQLSKPFIERIAPVPGLETDFITVYKTQVKDVIAFEDFHVGIEGLYDFEFVYTYPADYAFHMWKDPGMYHIVGHNEGGEFPYYGMWYMVDESLVAEKRSMNAGTDLDDGIFVEQVLYVGDLNYPEYRCSNKLYTQ